MKTNILKQIRVGNPEKTFDNISTKGCLQSVYSNIAITDIIAHVQGSNVYVDRNGKRHFIISHDFQSIHKKIDPYHPGMLLIFSEPLHGKVDPKVLSVNAGKYNHPGSFQIIGDYLFLPVEGYYAVGAHEDAQEGTLKDSHAQGSKVFIYSLENLENGRDPRKVCEVSFENHGAGMLGVTDKWLAIQDGSMLYLYGIDSFDGYTIELIDYGGYKITNLEGIGLLTDERDELYMVGLKYFDDKNEDFLYLYKLFPESKGCSFSAKELKTKHVFTDPGNGGVSDFGVHVRYGGGVYVKEDSIVCFGTGRNVYNTQRFNFNIFSSSNRIEVDCKQKPLHGQKNRSSQNFSVNGFVNRCKEIIFHIYKNGEECNGVTLQVYKDVDDGEDTPVYENVTNGSHHPVSTTSPLYFYKPSPEADAALIVVIEEYNP